MTGEWIRFGLLAQFEYQVNQNLEQHLELPAGEQEDRA